MQFNPRLKSFGIPQEIGLQNTGLFNSLLQKPLIPSTVPLNPPDVNANKPLIPSRAITDVQMGQGSMSGLDKFKQHLNTQPDRKDLQLGKWGKLLSGIAGTAAGYTGGAREGINVGTSLLNRPYAEAMEDWQTKGGRLKELSDLERVERGEGREDVRLKLEQNQDVREQMRLAQGLAKGELEMQGMMQDIMAGKKGYFQSNDGNTYEIDHITGKITNKGKTGEGIAETRTAEQKDWKERFGYEQFGRIELSALNQAHDKIMAGINNNYARGLRELDNTLDKQLASHQVQIDPRMRVAARQGAMDEILTQYPGMKTALFDVDAEGNISPKIDPRTGLPVDVKSWDAFSNALSEKTLEYIGLPSKGQAPWSDSPLEDMPYRIKAIQWIRQQGVIPTEDQIKKATEDFKRESITGTPNVSVVGQGQRTPQVSTPNPFVGSNPGTWIPGLETGIQNTGRAVTGALATPTLPSGPMIPGIVNAPSEIPIQTPIQSSPIIPPQNSFRVRPNNPLIPNTPNVPATPGLPGGVTAEDKELIDWAIKDLTSKGIPINAQSVAAAMQAEWNRRNPGVGSAR